MKRLASLAIVLALFVAVPLGQDADQSPAQLLEEQQLVQMFHMVMAQGRPDMKICHVNIRDQGVILLVNDKTLDIHLSHGDCKEGEYVADPDEVGDRCDCSCFFNPNCEL